MRGLAHRSMLMDDANQYLRVDNPLVRSAVEEFEKAGALIERIDDFTYTRSANGTGSVGGHVRHNLDFVNCVLNGIAAGRIDYSVRERDVRIEMDRKYASTALRLAVNKLHGLNEELLQRHLLVCSEIDRTIWFTSSVGRELEFINSHTVHHHALIVEKLAGCGIAVGDNFGVAFSTQEYWKATALLMAVSVLGNHN